jgi:hypothetical protein
MAHIAAFRNPRIALITAIAIRFIDDLHPVRIVREIRKLPGKTQRLTVAKPNKPRTSVPTSVHLRRRITRQIGARDGNDVDVLWLAVTNW